ncbi:MAG: Maf family protein [Planctomycetota bacterium]
MASASPRRKQLLADAGYEFSVVIPDIDESRIGAEGLSPVEYAEHLAQAKAASVADKFPEALVIGADTVVDFAGQIIGKPADAHDAEQITRKLFGAAHKVVTGVAIIRRVDHLEIVASDTTTVYPSKMSDEQLAEHIRGGSWRDKAGAYAMGLPMELLARLLKDITGSNTFRTERFTFGS